MENENKSKKIQIKNENKKKKQSGAGAGDENCPKDCNEVLALKKRLTDLVQNAANLQNDIKNNNAIIQRQHTIIAIMKQSVDKIVQKSNK